VLISSLRLSSDRTSQWFVPSKAGGELLPWPDGEGAFLLPRLGAPVIFLRQ